jgi:hypothetical protein
MNCGNNPRNLHEGHFMAHVGLYSKFNVFMSFYEDAVNKLYREVSEGNETADSIAMPLLFLMRHTMELGYKYTIAEICEMNGTKYNPTDDRHYFYKLHPRLKEEFYKLWQNGGVSDDKKRSFDEYYEITEAAMLWFDKIDPNGVNFRYPGFAHDKKVNLLEVKNKFDEAMTLLTVTVDVITDGMQS